MVTTYAKCALLALCIGISQIAVSQSGNISMNLAGAASTNPAILDLSDASNAHLGFLLPNVNLASNTDILTIPSPTTGMIVWNTNSGMPFGVGFYYWDGTNWDVIYNSGSAVAGANLTAGTGITSFTYNGTSAATVGLANTTVTAGTYGDASNYATYTVNAQGQLTAAGTLPLPTSLPPSGTAGGDLSGTYPSPNVVWANGETTYDGRYIKIGATAGGDLSGTYVNPTVAQINGSPLGTTTGASTGQVLEWTGTNWAPATLTAGTLSSANNGLSVSGGNTVQLGGALLQNTAVLQNNGTPYNMIYDLGTGSAASTGNSFTIQNNTIPYIIAAAPAATAANGPLIGIGNTAHSGYFLYANPSANTTTIGNQILIQAQQGAATSNGGQTTIMSGNGGATSGSGGTVLIQAGAAGTSGTGGAVNVTGGTGGSGSGGSVNINGGNHGTGGFGAVNVNTSFPNSNSGATNIGNQIGHTFIPEFSNANTFLYISNAGGQIAASSIGGSDISILSGQIKVNYLETSGTPVNVSSAASPTTGQVLMATSGTAATWQTLATGTLNAANNGLSISGGNTVQFGGTLLKNTTVTQNNGTAFNLIFDLGTGAAASTGNNFTIQNNSLTYISAAPGATAADGPLIGIGSPPSAGTLFKIAANANTTGNGNQIFILGQQAAVGFNGGPIQIIGGSAGAGGATGGSIAILGGASTGSNTGTPVSIQAGAGGTSGTGGQTTISGGTAGTTTGNGGPVNITGGSKTSGTMGAININTTTNSATGATNIGNVTGHTFLPEFTTAGSMPYFTGSGGQLAAIAPNSTATVEVLTQSSSGLPVWASPTTLTGFILNQSTNQTAANFNIQSAATGSVTAAMKQLAGQTADILDIQNSSGTVISEFNTSGFLGIGVTSPTNGMVDAENGAASVNVSIYGSNTATSGSGIGVQGVTSMGNGYGVYGQNTSSGSGATGVYGFSNSSGSAIGVLGTVGGASSYGVQGQSNNASGYGVYAFNNTGLTGKGLLVGGIANMNGNVNLGAPSTATFPLSANTGVLTFFNSTNAGAVILTPGATTATYTLTLPTSVGAATQVLTINSLAGNNATMGWSTPGTGTLTAANNGVSVSGTTVQLGDPAAGPYPSVLTGSRWVTQNGSTFVHDFSNGTATQNTSATVNWSIQNGGVANPYVYVMNNASTNNSPTVPGPLVGIGTSTPATALDVAQNNAIRVGGTYISSGSWAGSAGFADFASNAWFDGTNWHFPNTTFSNNSGAFQFANDAFTVYQTTTPFNAATFTQRLDIAPFTATNNFQGNVTIGTAARSANILNVGVTTANPTTTGFGILMTAQQGAATFAGGAVSINSGAGNTTGAGGAASLSAGAAGTTGAGGNITLAATNGGATGTGAAGTVSISAGTGGGATSSAGSAGGAVNITAGAAKGTGNNSGGSIVLTPGANTGTGAIGGVGINTPTPVCGLDIMGNNAYLHVAGTTNPVGAAQGAFLSWNETGGTGETDLINNQGGGSGGFMFFNTPAGGWATSHILLSSIGIQTTTGIGLFGIGPNTPTGILDVQASTAAASTAGAPINLISQAGGTGTGASGGAVNITAAAGGGTNGSGGSVVITPGVKTGTGTTGTVDIKGHLQTQQTTLLTAASITHTGGASAASLIGNCTDVAGQISVTPNNTTGTGTVLATVAFATPYAVAPIVILTYTTATTQNINCVNTTTTGFSILQVTNNIATSAITLNYMVIQTQ